MLLAVVVCLGGCAKTPLKIRKDSGTVGPWCGPNQRAQLGMRVVGKVGWGTDKWKTFLVDDTGKEYDPDDLKEEVWSYLERTGDAKRLMAIHTQERAYPLMTVVALKPLVVTMEMKSDTTPPKRRYPWERFHWLSTISVERRPEYQENMRWFSPDLGQRPTPLRFVAGVATIPLPKGRLLLSREGEKCKTERE